jgi:ribosomal-protein-alanine N-acetyltransferase
VELRIREATPGDFDELWRIDQLCFEPGIAYSRRELSWYMQLRGAFSLIAETRASARSKWTISGFILAQRLRANVGHVVTIDVLPQARRTRVGTRLMSDAEARLRECGCDTVVLETAVDNLAAIKFYKRLGFHIVKTIPRYYLDRLDALMMVKLLDQAQGTGHEARGNPQ